MKRPTIKKSFKDLEEKKVYSKNVDWLEMSKNFSQYFRWQVNQTW